MNATAVDVVEWLAAVAVPLASFLAGIRSADRLLDFGLWRRPGLLFRSLLAIAVVVPVVAVVVVRSIPLPSMVQAGILASVLAIGIGPPAQLMRTRLAHTRVGYEVALNVSLLLLALVFLPAFIAAYNAIFGPTKVLDAGAVATLVFTRQLIPLAAGVVIARLMPERPIRIAHYLAYFVNVAVIVIFVAIFVALWQPLVSLPGQAWAACAVIALAGVLTGRMLGGPAAETKQTLSAFSAMRYPALALLIGTSTRYGADVVPVIVVYVLVSVGIVLIDGLLRPRRKRSRKATRWPVKGGSP